MQKLYYALLFSLAIYFNPVLAETKAPPLTAKYSAKKITDTVFVIHGPLAFPNKENQGFMNNPGFILTSAGVVVIDAGGTVQAGDMVLEKIAKQTKAPVVAVFNTHIHGDHWLANQAIQAKYPEVKIYAHPNMIKVADEEGEIWVKSMLKLTDNASAGTVAVSPKNAVVQDDDIISGDTHFRIHHQGKAHTNTDIMIETFTEKGAHTVFLGDNVFYKRASRIEGGSFAGNIKTIEHALSLNATYYVPGHGQSGGKEVVTPYLTYLKTLYKAVETLYEEDVSDFEMKDKIRPLLKEWHDWAGFDVQFGKQVSLLYLEIEAASF